MAALLAASRGAGAARRRAGAGTAARTLSVCLRISKSAGAGSGERRTAAGAGVSASRNGQSRRGASRSFRRWSRSAPDDLLSAAQLGFLQLGARRFGGCDAAASEQVLAGQMTASWPIACARRCICRRCCSRRPEQPRAAVSSEAKQLAEKSLEKGYLKDALKYLQIAHENDPLDFDVMLKLGQTYNILKDDREAVRWFNLARRSPDPKIAAEASRAYHNLEPDRCSASTPRFGSSRCFRRAGTTCSPMRRRRRSCACRTGSCGRIVSVRFIGDTRGAVELANLGPQYLSERSVDSGARARDPNLARGDGLVRSRRIAALCAHGDRSGPRRAGLSRRSVLCEGRWESAGERTRTACSRKPTTTAFSSAASATIRCCIRRIAPATRCASSESFGGFHAQLFWNWNATADALGQYWANYVETGPGVRFRFEGMRAAAVFGETCCAARIWSIRAIRAARISTTCGWGSGMRLLEVASIPRGC